MSHAAHQWAQVRVPTLLAMKQRGEKIAMLTAYDASMASTLDRAGIDLLLVGDSLGMVILGENSTLSVTLEMILHHCRAVTGAVHRALVVADLPFLSYQIDEREAMRNAGRLIQEGGAAAVKLEGAGRLCRLVRRLTEAGIPVMGHLGLLPQHIHRLGGFRRVSQDVAEAECLLSEARALQDAGAFALVLECIPSELARQISSELTIPTIGIGSGPHCDGQVLVSYDAFGLYPGPRPSFAKQYADLTAILTQAARTFIEDVRSGRFPDQRRSSSTSSAE